MAEIIEDIADINAEIFIKKHFSRLSEKDRMVKALRDSIKESIRKALETYESERVHS